MEFPLLPPLQVSANYVVKGGAIWCPPVRESRSRGEKLSWRGRGDGGRVVCENDVARSGEAG